MIDMFWHRTKSAMDWVAGVVPGCLALLLGVSSAWGDQVQRSSPWMLVPEAEQQVRCAQVGRQLIRGGAGPVERLDDPGRPHDPEGAYQCVWDTPTGIYFYAEFAVDLVAPARQLAAGLRDFRDEAETTCRRVRWSQTVEPGARFAMVARGMAECLTQDDGLAGQHVMLWLADPGNGRQRLLTLQHSHYVDDAPHEAAVGAMIRYFEREGAD